MSDINMTVTYPPDVVWATKSEGEAMSVCAHCGGEVRFRNPSGHCDHLFWPENLTPEAKLANGFLSAEDLKARISSLEAENKRLREALEVIAIDPADTSNGVDYVKLDRAVARRALGMSLPQPPKEK